MSNNKQSSIDWLYNNLKSHFEHDGDLLEVVKMSFEQAKEMHEEEIMEAHYADRYGCFSKDYYNETFNTEECYHKGKYTYNKETFECHKCGLIVPNEYRFNSKEK